MSDDLHWLSRGRVTDGSESPTLPRMSSKVWPVAEFQEYIRQLMKEAGFTSYTQLSRATGVGENQFSTWKLGYSQPTQASLRRIAPALGVQPLALFIAAGLTDPDELGIDEPDLTVIPNEIRDLMEPYSDKRITDEQQSFIRRSVAALTIGLRAQLDGDRGRSTGRRRPA